MTYKATTSILGRLSPLNIDGMYLFGPIKEKGEALREKCGSMRIFVLFFCNKKYVPCEK